MTLREVQSQHSGFQADFDAAYDQLKELVGGVQGTSQATLIPLIMKSIQLCERVAKRSGDGGQAKQQLVMALITKLIEDSPMSMGDKVALQAVLETFGPAIIDGLIAADHGKLLASGWKRLRGLCAGCK